MTYANANEWLVAEGEIELRGERRRAVDLVLGPGGPLFTVEVRRVHHGPRSRFGSGAGTAPQPWSGNRLASPRVNPAPARRRPG
jgi:hypothetical protein